MTFLYVPGANIGYGRLGVYLAADLARRGVTVYDDDGRPAHLLRSEQTRLVAEGKDSPPSPTNVICWVSVPTHAQGWYDGQHRAIFTMWESARLPETFRETLHEFQTIIVPSVQNVELFSRYHDNVQLCLLGVDPELWSYREPQPAETFDFLIAGRGHRKGTDLAYKAFATVFGKWWRYDDAGRPEYLGPTDRPMPRLIYKSLKGQGDFYGPWTEHVVGRLDATEEADLYARCHAYIQPSRGEGFGLQPLQAIAMGRPTILTDAHGHASYAHLGIGIEAEMSKADYFIWGDAGEWWEPDFDQLCEAIWDVYTNYDANNARAKHSAEIVAKDWTWERTANRFMEILGPEMDKPYVGHGEWCTAEQELFPIVTNEDHVSQAAGITRFFKKGEVYWDYADMKRILFDAGKLDLACIANDDPGLALEQLPEIARYRAMHEHCPTCGEELNTRPKLADKILSGEVVL